MAARARPSPSVELSVAPLAAVCHGTAILVNGSHFRPVPGECDPMLFVFVHSSSGVGRIGIWCAKSLGLRAPVGHRHSAQATLLHPAGLGEESCPPLIRSLAGVIRSSV
jgi:hypothetical protein